MAVTKGKEVAARPKTEVATWSGFMKQQATKQQAAASSLTTGSVMASFQGGVLQVGGTPIKGNKVSIVVLSIMQERAYYEGKYDPKVPRTPVCYAYGDVDGDEPESPHEKSTQPQCETCEGCERSQWGTANEGTRRGQACKQQLKMAFILASTKAGASEAASSAVYFARIPPSSLKFAKEWLDEIGVQDENATFAWVTELSLEPSAKNVFDVHLNRDRPIPVEWRQPIVTLVGRAQKDISVPYPEFEEEAPAPKKAAAKKKY